MTHILDRNIVILVVEDDAPKLKAIEAFLSDIPLSISVLNAGSVASAVKIISKNKIDFAILDMSLPAFDILNGVSSGGRPQGFGGRDILRFIEDNQESTVSIILTQYEEFNVQQRSSPERLEDIRIELLQEFGSLLSSVIFYDGRRGNWRDQVKNLIFGMR